MPKYSVPGKEPDINYYHKKIRVGLMYNVSMLLLSVPAERRRAEISVLPLSL